MVDWTIKKYIELNDKYPTHTKLVRFLISGGTATFVNIALLYVFTDVFDIWYITSAIMAFVIAFVVSFTLQKFWTFQDMSKEGMHRQAIIYFTMASFNLCLNAGLLYLCVEYIGLHYLSAQILISILIAIENYFVYQFLIFRRTILIKP
ncbi:MAG: GtrA family protein [Candidatus Paceibacterota bacterium]|jgi:putative flippase GtrA